jgi:hypothetical protein
MSRRQWPGRGMGRLSRRTRSVVLVETAHHVGAARIASAAQIEPDPLWAVQALVPLAHNRILPAVIAPDPATAQCRRFVHRLYQDGHVPKPGTKPEQQGSQAKDLTQSELHCSAGVPVWQPHSPQAQAAPPESLCLPLRARLVNRELPQRQSCLGALGWARPQKDLYSSVQGASTPAPDAMSKHIDRNLSSQQ